VQNYTDNAPAEDITAEMLQQVNDLINNETDVDFMPGRKVNTVPLASDAALQLSLKISVTVIVTLVEQAAVVKLAELLQCFPAQSCTSVVNTTGGGDSFIGTLTWSMVNAIPLNDTMSFAASISALTIQKWDG
jgi:ribokinase